MEEAGLSLEEGARREGRKGRRESMEPVPPGLKGDVVGKSFWSRGNATPFPGPWAAGKILKGK